LDWRGDGRGVMNAASYADRARRSTMGKKECELAGVGCASLWGRDA
jgi:hypothetical protein